MALQVTGNIELNNGINLNSIYARITPSLNDEGNNIYCSTLFFTSKEAYKNYVLPINLNYELKLNTSYDRNVDTSDILLYSNEWIKFQLESKGLSVTIIDL